MSGGAGPLLPDSKPPMSGRPALEWPCVMQDRPWKSREDVACRKDRTRSLVERHCLYALSRKPRSSNGCLLTVESQFNTAVQYARRCSSAVETAGDPAAVARAQSILVRSLHLSGDLGKARVELEASIEQWSRSPRATIHIESLRASLKKIHAAHYELLTTEFKISLARGLWSLGRIPEAVALIDETMLPSKTMAICARAVRPSDARLVLCPHDRRLSRPVVRAYPVRRLQT